VTVESAAKTNFALKMNKSPVIKASFEVANSFPAEVEEGRKDSLWIITCVLNMLCFIPPATSVLEKWFVTASFYQLMKQAEDLSGISSILTSKTTAFWDIILLNNWTVRQIVFVLIGQGILASAARSIIEFLATIIADKNATERRLNLLRATLHDEKFSLTENSNISRLLDRVNDAKHFEGFLKHHRMQRQIQVLLAIPLALIIFPIGALITLFVFGSTVFARLMMRKVSLGSEDEKEKLHKAVHDLVLDCLRGIDIVRVSNQTQAEKAKLAGLEKPIAEIDLKTTKVSFFVDVVDLFLVCLILPMLATLTFHKSNTPEDLNTIFGLIALILLVDEGHKGLKILGETAEATMKGINAIAAINEFCAHKAEDGGHQSTAQQVISSQGIVFDQVGIYFDEEMILENVNLDIPQGVTCALVGESGTGKSSLCNAAALLIPFTGSIFFEGTRLNSRTKEEIRAKLAVVRQKTVLFRRTVRENIWYGFEGPPDDAKINEALRKVRLNLNLNEILTSGEARLSGGERQRMQLARLFCNSNARFVILDEALSALDIATRTEILKPLKQFLRTKTAILVTHDEEVMQILSDFVFHLNMKRTRSSEEFLEIA